MLHSDCQEAMINIQINILNGYNVKKYIYIPNAILTRIIKMLAEWLGTFYFGGLFKLIMLLWWTNKNKSFFWIFDQCEVYNLSFETVLMT